MASIWALFGARGIFKIFGKPAVLFGVALVAVVVSGGFGAWWGISSNRQAVKAWKNHAVALQLQLKKWEEITGKDSSDAENDREIIKRAEKIVEGQEDVESNEVNNRAVWASDDISMFKRLRGVTK